MNYQSRCSHRADLSWAQSCEPEGNITIRRQKQASRAERGRQLILAPTLMRRNMFWSQTVHGPNDRGRVTAEFKVGGTARRPSDGTNHCDFQTNSSFKWRCEGFFYKQRDTRPELNHGFHSSFEPIWQQSRFLKLQTLTSAVERSSDQQAATSSVGETQTRKDPQMLQWPVRLSSSLIFFSSHLHLLHTRLLRVDRIPGKRRHTQDNTRWQGSSDARPLEREREREKIKGAWKHTNTQKQIHGVRRKRIWFPFKPGWIWPRRQQPDDYSLISMEISRHVTQTTHWSWQEAKYEDSISRARCAECRESSGRIAVHNITI